ncbi:type I-E CRISPR-associated protein Cas6/Cse3/CasE [Lactiplantibacillus modestisalitolerans]|uniref:Type I-E CRISPR-associated protein Cas6/Cse3/CasE n=1 Tax=Lactiplantibacillus modestisalitolerans TaxID=1457219 RepID=A0ABV5WRG9_9LACO|nr:type I-E CRISPR-associated protein Cas6/Cse3/CasE [Lactiplantibacillus modestisalitolerans]
MYLSRVEVDTQNRHKTQTLTHLGAYHNWVEQSFPKEVATGERQRHLWRIDQLGAKRYLLVLSPEKPDLKALETYGVPGTAATKSYDEFIDQLQQGQILRFRLTANPTHTIYDHPDQRQGRIVPHITVAQQSKWLVDRAERAGFELLEQPASVFEKNELRKAFSVIEREWPILRKKKSRALRLSRVTFEGQLRITDLDVFKTILTNGIGREKAYGMGLMTVLPEN